MLVKTSITGERITGGRQHIDARHRRNGKGGGERDTVGKVRRKIQAVIQSLIGQIDVAPPMNIPGIPSSSKSSLCKIPWLMVPLARIDLKKKPCSNTSLKSRLKRRTTVLSDNKESNLVRQESTCAIPLRPFRRSVCQPCWVYEVDREGPTNSGSTPRRPGFRRCQLHSSDQRNQPSTLASCSFICSSLCPSPPATLQRPCPDSRLSPLCSENSGMRSS